MPKTQDPKNYLMIFGTPPADTVNADTKMVAEISDIFLNRYDRSTFELKIPDCFNDLYSVDANFELSASNTL